MRPKRETERLVTNPVPTATERTPPTTEGVPTATERTPTATERTPPTTTEGTRPDPPEGAAGELDEAALAARCRQGDPAAFGAFVRRHQDRVFHVCLRLCGRAAEAEDFAQEAFVRAWQALDRFDGRARLYTWVFRIAVNLVRSARRRERTARPHPREAWAGRAPEHRGPPTAGPAAPGPTPDARAVSRETQRAVQAALDRLEPEQRAILVLRDLEGLDYAEIAAILAVPTGTVKSRLHRARLALREELRPLLDGEATTSAE